VGGVVVARGLLGLALAVALGAEPEEPVQQQHREPGADAHRPALPAQAAVDHDEDHEPGDDERGRQAVAQGEHRPPGYAGYRRVVSPHADPPEDHSPGGAAAQARPRLGDRVESALDHHADVVGEIERGERELEQIPKSRKGSLRRRAVWLAVGAVSLYLVAPSVIETLGSWEDIQRLAPGWLVAMALLQLAALACMWALQRISIAGTRWRTVISSQLASNALAKVAPGGGAMGAALQYRMLVAAGTPPGRVAAGLTACSLLTLAVVLALPVFAIPAIVRGGVDHTLLEVAAIGAIVLVALFAAGGAVVASERPLLWVGGVVQRIRNRLRRRAEPLERLPQRLVRERDRILAVLGPRWHTALVAATGRWVLDFGCLVAALLALDAMPRPGLALLAFCSAQLLAQIPITPGGLGFVEAGLTATLALAGVSAGDAVLATFAYRLFAYWLQLPLGLVGLALARGTAAPASGSGPSSAR
jgi:uncharacterized protein (TIRG00374 family)